MTEGGGRAGWGAWLSGGQGTEVKPWGATGQSALPSLTSAPEMGRLSGGFQFLSVSITTPDDGWGCHSGMKYDPELSLLMEYCCLVVFFPFNFPRHDQRSVDTWQSGKTRRHTLMMHKVFDCPREHTSSRIREGVHGWEVRTAQSQFTNN